MNVCGNVAVRRELHVAQAGLTVLAALGGGATSPPHGHHPNYFMSVCVCVSCAGDKGGGRGGAGIIIGEEVDLQHHSDAHQRPVVVRRGEGVKNNICPSNV